MPSVEKEKKNIDGLLDGVSVEATKHKAKCYRQITKLDSPAQVSWRLPGEQVKWLSDNITGYTNASVSILLEYAMREVAERLKDGEMVLEKLLDSE